MLESQRGDHLVHLGVGVARGVPRAAALALGVVEEVEDVFRVIGRHAPAQQVEIRVEVGDQREVLRPRRGREVHGDPDLRQHADGGLADRLVVDVAVIGAVELHGEAVAVARLLHQGAGGLDVVLGVGVELLGPAGDGRRGQRARRGGLAAHQPPAGSPRG